MTGLRGLHDGGRRREGIALEDGQEDQVLYTGVPSHAAVQRNGFVEVGLSKEDSMGAEAGIFTLGGDEEDGEDGEESGDDGGRPRGTQ